MASSSSNSQAVFCFLEIYEKKTKKNVLAHPLMAPFEQSTTSARIEGIGLVAKDVTASQDALVDIFERIESFFRWLEEYSDDGGDEGHHREDNGRGAWDIWDCDEGDETRTSKEISIGGRDIEDALGRLDN
ncbi:hypothetical protein EDB89DRAFT_2076254 [Lactarius sanguifluus]|nr:hypothetical protein EDB89DRAFT_2076254 [Lactarius sanguifluus]